MAGQRDNDRSRRQIGCARALKDPTRACWEQLVWIVQVRYSTFPLKYNPLQPAPSMQCPFVTRCRAVVFLFVPANHACIRIASTACTHDNIVAPLCEDVSVKGDTR